MPAYASHSMDYEALKLGSRIQEERQRQGLTLHQLGTRSKISTSRLSQIENGHHVLDAVQAGVIAEALGVSLEAFLPADVSIPYVIARDADVRTIAAGQPDPESPVAGIGEQRHPLAGLFVAGTWSRSLLVSCGEASSFVITTNTSSHSFSEARSNSRSKHPTD